MTAIHAPNIETKPSRFVRPRWSTGWIGAILLAVIVLACLLTLPISLQAYETIFDENAEHSARPPSWLFPMGTDTLQRSLFWRVMLGGAISLAIGLTAATISVVIGVLYGATSALVGGRVDSVMMRVVDVLYGLPYILLVVLINIALQPWAQEAFEGHLHLGFTTIDLPFGMAVDTARMLSGVITLLVAIGGVSWLTMARVIRGQVLSLREQPFVEASLAAGAGTRHILIRHMLPNLLGPIIVYATLTVPQAILQESFLSFLGIGVQAPLPSWGNLASDGLPELYKLGGLTGEANDAGGSGGGSQGGGGMLYWWLLLFPCLMLGLTLMALNFMGDALRDYFDPKSSHRR